MTLLYALWSSTYKSVRFRVIQDRRMPSSMDVAEPFPSADVSFLVKSASSIIREAFETYGEQGVALSFNGGKDCTVLAQLLAMARPSQQTLLSLYVVPADPFPETEDFVQEAAERYHLDVKRYTMSMKEALQQFLAEHPQIKAILIGTRRTDPYCEHLKPFHPTDNGWPSVVRVHPLLDWHYADVWSFLRKEQVPYCSLYDQGYTSLGGRSNTRPNRMLCLGNSPAPAWQLTDERLEREGRL